MNNVMWNYRHVAALGLVALLAGCGGGGGGGTTAATCTADCLSGNVTDGSGNGVSGVYVTATNPSTGQTCSTSVGTTSIAGSYSLSASNCGGSTVIVSAPSGGGTVVNSCTVGQTCNINPGTTTSVAAYAGTWAANYSSSTAGGDSGSCSVVVKQDGTIDATANNCKSSLSGKSFTLGGSLNAQGVFNGTTDLGAAYTGTFNAAQRAAVGSWSNSSAGTEGTWGAALTAPAAP
jgi:hypothetical protein